VLERTSCHYGHDFHSVLKQTASLGWQTAISGFFLESLAMFVLTKVRGVSENRIKGRQIGAFVAAAVVIVPSSC